MPGPSLGGLAISVQVLGGCGKLNLHFLLGLQYDECLCFCNCPSSFGTLQLTYLTAWKTVWASPVGESWPKAHKRFSDSTGGGADPRTFYMNAYASVQIYFRARFSITCCKLTLNKTRSIVKLSLASTMYWAANKQSRSRANRPSTSNKRWKYWRYVNFCVLVSLKQRIPKGNLLRLHISS